MELSAELLEFGLYWVRVSFPLSSNSRAELEILVEEAVVRAPVYCAWRDFRPCLCVSPPLARSFVSPSYFSLLAVFLWLEAAWSKFYHFFGAGLYSMNSNQRSQPKVPKVQLGTGLITISPPKHFVTARCTRSNLHTTQATIGDFPETITFQVIKNNFPVLKAGTPA